MTRAVDVRRITLFLVLAFGIAWATGLVIYLTGGLQSSPRLGGRITLAFVLLATAYMGAPALAHLVTRLITREGWHDLYLRPRLRRGWPYWVICWFGPGLLMFVGMAIFFAIFPEYLDSSLETVQKLLQQAAPAQALAQINPWSVVISQTVVAILISPILNAIPVLGEEFGWRAYLLPKLMPLGGKKAVVLTGIIWGAWHWPVILMGYNYGFKYPGAPWLGCVAMVWFTLVLGTLIGWATLRARSVWPGVIGHGAINGIAGIAVLITRGEPNTLLGPAVVGVIGSLGFTIVALWLLVRPHSLDWPAAEEHPPLGELAAEPQGNPPT
jgi:uncharacterized protein